MDRVHQDSRRVLIVSSDKDVSAAFEAWDLPTPLLVKKHDLLPSLFTVEIDSGAATAVILRYLGSHLPAPQGHNLLDVGAIPDLRNVVSEALGLTAYHRIDGASLAAVTELVGLTTVTVESSRLEAPTPSEASEIDPGKGDNRDDEVKGERGPFGHRDKMVPHTVRATLMLLATADAVVVATGAQGDEFTEVVPLRDLLLRASMVFELEAGMMAKPPRPDGEVAVFGYARRFPTSHDAMNELIDALTCVPGLDLRLDWHEEDHVELAINGHQVLLRPALGDDTWSIDFVVDDEVANISCEYEPEPAWYEDDRGSEPCPYIVDLLARRPRGANHVVDPLVRRPRTPNPVWALAAWLTKLTSQ
jgi:hypothetical protein